MSGSSPASLLNGSQSNGELASAVRIVHGGKRFLLTCHVMPDADALGSMLGLASVLRSLGKDVYLYNRDPVPPRRGTFPIAR
jgi:nanoRNase/pAp phosphatase (c-di-AMP/oligoRNAs hydrolase)